LPYVESACQAAFWLDTPVSVFNVKTFPEAQAVEGESCAESRNVPDVAADHNDTWVRVSDVPPFVHAGNVPFSTIDSGVPDGAAHVAATLVVEPTEMLAVPAAPGSPVWIWT
jgi:hypothetical protein